MTKNPLLQRDRNYLYAVLEDGDLRNHTGVEGTIELALDSKGAFGERGRRQAS